MDLNNKGKKYLKIYQKTGSEKFFALLDGMKRNLEDDIDEQFRHRVRI